LRYHWLRCQLSCQVLIEVRASECDFESFALKVAFQAVLAGIHFRKRNWFIDAENWQIILVAYSWIIRMITLNVINDLEWFIYELELSCCKDCKGIGLLIFKFIICTFILLASHFNCLPARWFTFYSGFPKFFSL
jgi:hypothetical protein